MYVCMYVCMCMYMCVYMCNTHCVCMYVCICVGAHTCMGDCIRYTIPQETSGNTYKPITQYMQHVISH